MKNCKTIHKIILAIVFVVLMAQLIWGTNHYSKSGMVWEINGNCVTVRLSDGEMCSYRSSNPPSRFEKVNVVFDTNGTRDRCDDIVVGVK